MRVLLVSTYEMGHQPLGLASPAAALRARGHEVRCFDLAVERLEPRLFEDTILVGISVPMHTGARLGIRLAERVRALNPDAHICFYGLYASSLHEQLTVSGLADSVVGGEYEGGLCDLVDQLAAGRYGLDLAPAGVGPRPRFDRQRYPVPDRSGLPPLERYAQVDDGAGGRRLAGYVEASRGCAHVCRHCPITPVYGGRLRLVQRESVLADIDQLVALGAGHVTFGDPDFLNAVPHSMAIVDALRRRHPDVSFDVTTKVEHLIEHAALLPRLRDAGCLFITSAFESVDDDVLRYLAKGHTRADMERVLALAERERLVLRPTWVAFTPWVTVEGYLDLLRFIEQHGLVGHVQPVQYALKLLLPPGSPLIEDIRRQGLLGAFDERGLSYTWHNPDARVAALQTAVARIVEEAAGRCTCEAGEREHLAHDIATFEQVKRATLAALGRREPVGVAPQPARPVPRLTEDWFC